MLVGEPGPLHWPGLWEPQHEPSLSLRGEPRPRGAPQGVTRLCPPLLPTPDTHLKAQSPATALSGYGTADSDGVVPTDNLDAKHPLLQPQKQEDFKVKLSDQSEFTELL